MQEGKERERKERRENGCIYLFHLFLSLSPSLSLRTADTFLRIILSYRISYHYHDRPRRITKTAGDECEQVAQQLARHTTSPIAG